MTKTQIKFSVGEVCVFTNKGSSGVRSNDGKRCVITGTKDPKDWHGMLDEPGYVIEFVDSGGHGFGCRESELAKTRGE